MSKGSRRRQRKNNRTQVVSNQKAVVTPKPAYVPKPDYTPPANRTELELPTCVVTLDMDGTMEDPYHCCGGPDYYGGTDKCRHLRKDNLAIAQAIRNANPGCEFVILSWRVDLSDIIAEWCEHVGIKPALICTDMSPDTKSLQHGYAPHQVPFKLGVVKELQARGVRVIAAMDDNDRVITAMSNHGVIAIRSPHLVKVDTGGFNLPKVPEHAKQYHVGADRYPMTAGAHTDGWDYWGGYGYVPKAQGVTPRLNQAATTFLAGRKPAALRSSLLPDSAKVYDHSAVRTHRQAGTSTMAHLGSRWANVPAPGDPTDEDLALEEMLNDVEGVLAEVECENPYTDIWNTEEAM